MIGSNYTGHYLSNFITYLITSSAAVDKKVDNCDLKPVIITKHSISFIS